MERSLCAGRVPYPPGLRRRERPPYGAGETRRPPGKMQFPRHTVGADSISARFAAARGLREGHAPPLHGIQARPAKWACRGRPGERRAGCPHPAGPRGGAGFRGRDKSRPYGQILCFRQTEQPRCLPRFAGEAHAPRRGPRQGRPGRYGIGPYMGCLRRRGVCGRGMPLPYMPSGNDRPNGIATADRANVGRDALIPPGPAAAGMFPVLNFNDAAGVNARPTDRGNTAATRENATPAVHRRSGFHIRPVRGGAGFRGRDKSRPYE